MSKTAQEMVEQSDGALTEATVLDSLVTDYFSGESVNLDDLLDLNEKAIHHHTRLRSLIKKVGGDE